MADLPRGKIAWAAILETSKTRFGDELRVRMKSASLIILSIRLRVTKNSITPMYS